MNAPAAKTESMAGPLLVLLAGLGFTGVMAIQLGTHLHFRWHGVGSHAVIQSKSTREKRQLTLRFEDADGRQHTIESEALPLDLWEELQEGETLSIRYLPENPEQVRPDSQVRTAWLWSGLWTSLGLAVTLFGVLLMWGRRARRPRRWPPTSGW